MTVDPPELLQRAYLAALPARGRAVPVQLPRPRRWQPRHPKALPHLDGPRAERRALASPRVRPPHPTLELRAEAARYRIRVALAARDKHGSGLHAVGQEPR